MTATITERSELAGAGPAAHVRPEATQARSRRRPAALMAAGTMLLAASVGSLVLHRSEREAGVSVAAAEALPAPGPAARSADMGITDGTYEPGHSSGWHVHPGMHSVVVLTGTLTIYDQDCRRQQFGPGETYLGGDHPHLARNEEPETLRFAVTYVYDRSSPLGPGTTVPAPPACDPAII
jgi:quercetin dioxygenase-like cupin family protein